MSNHRRGEDGRETLIFTCAGAAHSGQVANRAGVDIARAGAGALFCTAAVAAAIPAKLARARRARRCVVIDGCEDHCAAEVMARADLPVDLHVDVTALGIAKQPDRPAMLDDARRVAAHVTRALGERP